MSVVAWDGRYLVADRMAECAGATYQVSKLIVVEVQDKKIGIAATGEFDGIGPLVDWFVSGKPTDKWPSAQQTSDKWTRLIVVEDGKLHWYERTPYALGTTSPFMAFGAGRDFALGAMDVLYAQGGLEGAAILAVKATNMHCNSTGKGKTIFDSHTGELWHADD